MLRTYKYLLRPTPEQAQALDFLLWQSRLIYNNALEERINTYQATGKGISYKAQWAHFRDLRHSNPATFGKLNAVSLQHLLRRLDKAFQAFFRRVKADETPGFPRFKGRSRFKSMEYTYGDGCKLRQNEQGRRSFYVQNVGACTASGTGEIRMCFHRPLPAQATLKHAVVKRVNERWYVCLMLETPIPEPVLQRLPTGQQIGVDVGLKSLLALSNGELIENPQWLKNSLSKLRRVQRHAARQEKSSHRQRKTYARIARLHEQITHQRRDYLTAEFDLIAVEDLTLAFMNRNEHLSLASHDAGLGELRHLLTYKAEEAGRQLVAVNPANTSQRCSGCGRIVPKGLGCEFTNVLLVV